MDKNTSYITHTKSSELPQELSERLLNYSMIYHDDGISDFDNYWVRYVQYI